MSLGNRSQQEVLNSLEMMENFKFDKITPIIFWGTLLGAVREKNFIPHDSDIDFGYVSRFKTLPEVRVEMENLYQELFDKGMLIKYFVTPNSWVTKMEKPFQGIGQAHVLTEKCYFDLFTLWFDEEGDLNSYPLLKIGKKRDYLPFQEYEILGRKFMSINNAEMFLEKVYGSDWRTPQNKKSALKKHVVL